MKIFQDSGRTFLPRIDRIYLQTRGIALLLVAGWMILGLVERNYLLVGVITLATLLTHYVFLLVYSGRKKFRITNLYLLTTSIDLASVSAFIMISGGVNSAFYLGYYLIVSLASYLLTRQSALVVTVVVSVSYLAIVWPELHSANEWGLVFLRISPCWVILATISHISEHLRRSETRMLGLFDTLNKRTSELEKIQAQLESIYDNSRILAAILDVDEVIKAVMQIVNGVLKYPAASLLLKQGETGFVYRGRVVDEVINLRMKPLESSTNELLSRVVNAGSLVRIVDAKTRDDYTPLHPDTRSVMIAPMIVRRQTVGALVAESTSKDVFSERDEKMFSVVARSAAMAIDNSIVHREMEELTVTDDLTRAYNYRYFSSKLSEEQRRAARYHQPLSLIMLDIDHFKNFNDNFGHESGNLILKELAQIIRICVRDTDIFARYGGEEFAIILPQTTLGEAKTIANRIRESVEAARISIANGIPKQSVTVSVGLTSYPENGKSFEEILHLADQALYRAKGSGRNAVATV